MPKTNLKGNSLTLTNFLMSKLLVSSKSKSSGIGLNKPKLKGIKLKVIEGQKDIRSYFNLANLERSSSGAGQCQTQILQFPIKDNDEMDINEWIITVFMHCKIMFSPNRFPPYTMGTFPNYEYT